MATQVVELTGDEAALLRSLQKVIDKELEMEKKLRDAGNAGDAAGTQIEAAMAKLQRESDQALRGLLGDLKGLGPEGQAAATALKSHFQQSGKAGFQSFGQVIDQLKLIDPAAAAAAQSAADAMVQAGHSATKAWDDQIALLRAMGPEGAAAAKTIETDLASAAASAAGGMDQILNKLEQLNPEAAKAAAKIRSELGESARYSEKEFGGVLQEMRAMGPEGKKAADAIRKELVAAGRIAEKSIEDVAIKFNSIDPAVGKAASKIISDMRTAGTESGTVIDSLSAKVTSYVAGIGLASGAWNLVKRALEQVNREQDEGLAALNKTKDTDRELLQVSTSAADFAANRKQRDQLSAQFGVDRNDASKVIFDSISLGFKESVPEILRASQVLDPTAAASAGGKLKNLYSNENLSATQIISGTLTAATVSSANFDELARVLPNAAEGATQLGTSSAETLATVAILATDFKDAAVAADRTKAFTSKAAQDERFKGKEITEVVQSLDAMQPDERKDFLKGSDEVNAFYNAALRRMKEIRSLAAEVRKDVAEAAQGGGELNAKIKISETDPILVARRKEAMAKQSLEVTQADVKGLEGSVGSSAAAGARDTFLKEDNFLVRAAGDGVFGIGLTKGFSGAAATLGANEEDATAATVGGVRGTVRGIVGNLLGPVIGDMLAPRSREPQAASYQLQPPIRTDPALLEEQRKQTALLQEQNALLAKSVSNTEPRQQPVTPGLSAQQP